MLWVLLSFNRLTMRLLIQSAHRLYSSSRPHFTKHKVPNLQEQVPCRMLVSGKYQYFMKLYFFDWLINKNSGSEVRVKTLAHSVVRISDSLNKRSLTKEVDERHMGFSTYVSQALHRWNDVDSASSRLYSLPTIAVLTSFIYSSIENPLVRIAELKTHQALTPLWITTKKLVR